MDIVLLYLKTQYNVQPSNWIKPTSALLVHLNLHKA